MDTLGLDREHGSGIQDGAKFILNNFGQSQLVLLLDSLEALSDLRILGERLKLLEQAEVGEPVFGSNTLRDEIRELGVGLMNESSRGDAWFSTISIYTRRRRYLSYHWSHS